MTTAPTDAEKINPRIRTIEIGIKTLKPITLYPFSAPIQRGMKEMLEETVLAVLNARTTADNINGSETLDKNAKDLLIIRTMFDTAANYIQKNFATFLTLATCDEHKGEELLNDMDNDQILEVVDNILDMNFGGALKKVPQIFGKWKAVFLKEGKAVLTQA